MERKNGMGVLARLFASMFTISAFTFGGGYVIVSLMKKKFVDEYGWLARGGAGWRCMCDDGRARAVAGAGIAAGLGLSVGHQGNPRYSASGCRCADCFGRRVAGSGRTFWRGVTANRPLHGQLNFV
ncbi:MAG: chromate transporter [Clostridia bacterium]|nr:chromate transporter [Clostridia bacterium]